MMTESMIISQAQNSILRELEVANEEMNKRVLAETIIAVTRDGWSLRVDRPTVKSMVGGRVEIEVRTYAVYRNRTKSKEQFFDAFREEAAKIIKDGFNGYSRKLLKLPDKATRAKPRKLPRAERTRRLR